MGSNKEEREVGNKRFERIVKACTLCLGSFLISIVGGLILTWWELKHHPTNSQLWMVPFGLVVFVTPAIVWISLFISDICISKEAGGSSLENSVGNSERDDRTSCHVIRVYDS